METLVRYIAAPSRCGYLPEQSWRLEYEHVAALSPQEYMQRLLGRWLRSAMWTIYRVVFQRFISFTTRTSGGAVLAPGIYCACSSRRRHAEFLSFTWDTTLPTVLP